MKTDIRMTSCQLICNNERKVMEIDKPVDYYTEKKQDASQLPNSRVLIPPTYLV